MDAAFMPLVRPNAVRLQVHALAYDFGDFLRTLATPEPIEEVVADKPEREAH
jgi:hypothetical protein